MRHVRDEIIPDRLARRVDRRVRLHVGTHVQRANGESHNGGVALGNEFILGEALDVEEEVRREGVQEAVPFPHAEVLLRLHAVVFREDRGERDLRDDVAVKFVLEERGRGQVEGEDEVAHRFHDDFGGFFEPQAVSCVGFGGDALGFGFQLSLENVVDDARARFGSGAPEREVHVVEEPGEEVDGVGLVEEVEFLVGLAGDLLDELVGGDVGFEGAGVPDFADEDGEAGCEF